MRQGSGHDRSIQQTRDLPDDVVVRHTDTHFLPVTEDFRQPVRSVQNKGEGTGQVAFHQFEDVIVYLGIFADTAQVVADDREIVFLWVYFLNPADALDGTFLQAVATDGIHGIRGIDNQSPVIQQVYNPLQVLGIIVFLVKFEYHNCSLFNLLF